MKRVVILGAGFGGLAAAAALEGVARDGLVDAVLIDRAPSFQMGFAIQWAFDGRRPPEAGRRAYPPAAARHVRFVPGLARAIDLQARTVETDAGTLPFDRLVIALGAELTMGSVDGLAQAAHNLYAMEGALRFRAALDTISGGTVVVAIAATPYKCPPAPFEYALLVEELLRKRGVRDSCKVVVTSPEAQPMTVAGKAVGEAVVEMLAARGIEFRPKHKLARVDPALKAAHFEAGPSLPYDVLAAVPKHRAPEVARDAGLADESGFVPVELGTFRTKHDGVFAVGDVAGIKLANGSLHPKAGVFAEAQGAVVGGAIAAEVRGEAAAPYAGLGVCYIDVGGGHAVPVEANLLAEDGPRFRLEPPSAAGVEAKAAFERERLERWFGRA